MADVPIYNQSVQVQAPGIPETRVEPMPSVIAPTNVAEAAAGIGKGVEEIGSTLERHMVMVDKMQAQQNAYDHLSEYRSALQQTKQQFTSRLGKDVGAIGSPDGIYAQYRQIVDGTPSAPGRPGTPPLKAKFMQGLGGYEQKIFERGADNYNEAYGGQILDHQSTQFRAYIKQGHENALDDVAQTAVDVKSPAGLSVLRNQVHSAFFDESGKLQPYAQDQGWTPEEAKKMELTSWDNAAQGAVVARAKEDYKSAQTLLDKSGVQPTMRQHLLENVIKPAQASQYAVAGWDIVKNDQALRDPTTLKIDESKAEPVIENMIKKEGIDPGHQIGVKNEILGQMRAHNTGLDTKESMAENAAVLNIYKMSKEPNAKLSDAKDQFIKTAGFVRGNTFQSVDDFANKAFSKDPEVGETAWKSVPQQVQDLLNPNKPESKMADIDKKFPYKQDKEAFISTAKQVILDSGVRTQAAASDVYQKLFDRVPTGAARFMGFGKQTKMSYQIDEDLQKNQPVVNAIGGVAAAKSLAYDLGGTEKLAPDTPQSKAIMLLKQYNKPINVETISQVIKNHPDLLK